MGHQKVLISRQVSVCEVWLVMSILVRSSSFLWAWFLLFNLAYLLSVLLEKRLLELQILLRHYLLKVKLTCGTYNFIASERLYLGSGWSGDLYWCRLLQSLLFDPVLNLLPLQLSCLKFIIKWFWIVAEYFLSWLGSDENVELGFMSEVVIVEVAEYHLFLQYHSLKEDREVLEIYFQQVQVP